MSDTAPAGAAPRPDGATLPASAPGVQVPEAVGLLAVDPEPRLDCPRCHHAWFRLAGACLVGVAVGAACWWWVPTYAVLLGWTTIGVVYVAWTWLLLWPMNAQATAVHATREAPGGTSLHLLLVGAGLASIVGLMVLMASSTQSRWLTALVAVCPVVSSWATVHTLYALRYAREYFRDGGGIDFHIDQPPRYSDFAYVGFTVGFSFAISDTDLCSSRMRRIALGHALLAYLFGTVFVAALVNIVTSLEVATPIG